MEEVKDKPDNFTNFVVKFEVIPADMMWMSSHSGELNNCATYFSSFAYVSKANKTTIRVSQQHGNHGITKMVGSCT